MKKIFIVVSIVVLGVAGLAGATHLVGGKMENRYFALLDQYGQFGPFRLTSQSYERGFLTSRARTVLELQVPQPDADQDQGATEAPVSLTFEHIVRHGPLPAGQTPDGRISLAPMLALVETRLVEGPPGDKGLEEMLDDLPGLRDSHAYTLFGLGGGGSIRMMVPAFEKTFEEEGVTLNWGGMTCDSRFSGKFAKISGTFVMPRLQVQGEQGHLLWNGVNVDFDLRETFPLVYLGKSQGRFGSLEMNLPDPENGAGKELLMKGLSFNSQSSADEGTVSYLSNLEMAEVIVDGETFGPGRVEVAARNLDGEALSHFQTGMLEMYREDLFEPEALVPRMMENYMRLFMELSKGSPEIEISRLQFATPEGEFDGSARVKLHGQEGLVPGDMSTLAKNLDAEARVIMDEGLLRSMLAGKIEGSIREARDQGTFPAMSDEEINQLAVHQVDGQLQIMTQQNFLVRGEDGKFTSHARFDHGEFLINGRQVMPPTP